MGGRMVSHGPHPFNACTDASEQSEPSEPNGELVWRKMSTQINVQRGGGWALHACGLGAARLWTGRCTLVDWALHVCGLGAKDICITLRTPIGLPIKGRLIMALYVKLQTAITRHH